MLESFPDKNQNDLPVEGQIGIHENMKKIACKYFN
jgi:hypothetical protein